MRSSSLQVSAGRNHLNLSKTKAQTLAIVATCQLREWNSPWTKGDDRGSRIEDNSPETKKRKNGLQAGRVTIISM